MLLTTLANFSALSMVTESKSRRRAAEVAEKTYILSDLRASAVRSLFSRHGFLRLLTDYLGDCGKQT